MENDVEKCVTDYIKKNNIKTTNNENTLRYVHTFNGKQFGILSGMIKVYDAGNTHNDCLILSFLSCMSKTYRKCSIDDRAIIADYYRRYYLPLFFTYNSKFFINICSKVQDGNRNLIIEESKRLFIIKDGIIKIRYDAQEINLRDLLESTIFLPELIAFLLCKFFKINLLTFTVPRDQTTLSYNLNDYKPGFEYNNSLYTISICGQNTHFQTCEFCFPGNNNFISDINIELIEKIIEDNYQEILTPSKYSMFSTIFYKKIEYRIFKRNFFLNDIYEEETKKEIKKIESLYVSQKGDGITGPDYDNIIQKISSSSNKKIIDKINGIIPLIFVINNNNIILLSKENLLMYKSLDKYIKIDYKIFKLSSTLSNEELFNLDYYKILNSISIDNPENINITKLEQYINSKVKIIINGIEPQIFTLINGQLKLLCDLNDRELNMPNSYYMKLGNKIYKLYKLTISNLEKNIPVINYGIPENKIKKSSNIALPKYSNQFKYFNESYEQIKKNIPSVNTSEENKEYIRNFIDEIFTIIDKKYIEQNPLHSYRVLFLEKFKKYMNSIIRVLLQKKNKDKIQKPKIDEISNYIYENMLNDLLISIKSYKNTHPSINLFFDNKPYLSKPIFSSKNKATINKNLTNIISPKYLKQITEINI